MTKYKLSAFSYFSIEGNSVKLVIGPSNNEFAIIGLCVFTMLFDLFGNEEGINWPLIAFMFIFGFYLFQFKQVEIDLLNNIVVQKKQIFGFTFKTTTHHWIKSSYFNYKIEYDNYEKVSSIKILVNEINSKDCKTLCEFKSEKDFNTFKNAFNQKFPSKAIKEWHE